jgi:hypothetical protein
MKKICCLLLMMIGCMGLPASQAVADTPGADWELVMDKNGIKAYSRKIADSGIFEFRAVMVADAPVEVVGEMLRDVPAVSQWLPYCNQSYLLEAEDRNNFTIYFSLDLPWPVADRDLVMKTATTYDLDHGRAVSNLYRTEVAACPPKGSHIRMPEMKGQYVFEFITREKTGIIHTYRADIGGSLPEWMANFATKYNMYNTFMNMKELFKNKKYIALAGASPDRELCERILEDKDRVKKILMARLREFIQDLSFVDMLQESRGVDDVLREENGRVSELLLYGWGSEESRKKAVRVVLEIFLSGFACDKELAGTILNDDKLAETILRGPAPGAKTSRQSIEAYLQTGGGTAGK